MARPNSYIRLSKYNNGAWKHRSNSKYLNILLNSALVQCPQNSSMKQWKVCFSKNHTLGWSLMISLLTHFKPVFHCIETATRRCSVKKVFLKISQNSEKNTCVRLSFLISCRPKACNFIKKETPTQVFFCNFCETFGCFWL